MIYLQNSNDNLKISGTEAYLLFDSSEDISFTTLKKRKLFKGDAEEYFTLSTLEKEYPTVFLGLGTNSLGFKFLEVLRMLSGKLVKNSLSTTKDLFIHLPESLLTTAFIRALGEGLTLGTYSFDTYLSKKEEKTLENIFLLPSLTLSENLSSDLQEALTEGIILGEATILSRQLGNEPASVVTPSYLADLALDLGKDENTKVTIYDYEDIKKFKMEAFLAVASGSSFKPKLIVVEYNPLKDLDGPHLGLVGKGITFDTGGLSLKPASSMLTMQGDMCGAASTLCALKAISQSKLPLRVTGVIAACDNAVSGKSYRPNDIITSRSGKTIFVGNTDAEGRLTLIDALDFILTEKKVDLVLDIATLTGAAEIALGQKIAAAVTNNENFLAQLKEASLLSGERFWELPHDEDFLELIKSPVADLTNSGGRFGGTITAGLFVGSVVGTTPWIHLDIAGPSWTEKNKGYFSKGATGYGTRLLYQLVKVIVNG